LAFQRLVELHRDTVRAVIRRTVRDHTSRADCRRILAEEEELFEQAVTQALGNLARYHPGRGPFGAWLARVPRNKPLDHRRTPRRDQARPQVLAARQPPASPLREPLEPTPDPCPSLDQGQRALLALRNGLCLPDCDRELLARRNLGHRGVDQPG